MADLSELQSSGVTKIVGSDLTGNETNAVNASINGDLGVSDGLSSGGVQGALTLTTANTALEAKVGAARLSPRKSLTIQAFDNILYWGYTSAVTTATGTQIPKGRFVEFSLDATDSAVAVYLISAVAGATARITESP